MKLPSKKRILIEVSLILGWFIFRFLIEYVREPDLHLGLFFNFISMGQILCIPFFIFGILIIQNVKQKKN